MKLSLFAIPLAAAFVLPLTAGASPTAHARQHKPAVAKSSHSARPIKPRGRAFILNGAVPGRDPNRMDHMALGRKMHPERLDNMNAAPRARRAPVTPK